MCYLVVIVGRNDSTGEERRKVTVVVQRTYNVQYNRLTNYKLLPFWLNPAATRLAQYLPESAEQVLTTPLL